MKYCLSRTQLSSRTQKRLASSAVPYPYSVWNMGTRTRVSQHSSIKAAITKVLSLSGEYVIGYDLGLSVELAMAIPKLRVSVIASGAGVHNTQYPLGNIPATPDITVSQSIPSISGIEAGDAFSQNFASYASGADLGGATYSIVAVTGTLIAVGMSFSTTTLSAATLAEGGFTGFLRVSKSGYNFDSNQFSITVSAALIADVLSPAIPSMITAVYNTGTDLVDISGDYSSDAITSTTPVSNPVSTYLEIDDGLFHYSVFATKIQSITPPIMAGYSIGSITAPGFSRSGNSITINNITDGNVSDSVEDIAFYGGAYDLPVGGRVGFTLSDYTCTGYDWATGGLMIREASSFTTSKAPSLFVMKRSNSNTACPLIGRSIQGGTMSYLNDAAISGDTQCVIERTTANTWTFYQYSNNSIIMVRTLSQVMSGPLMIGAYLCRGGSSGAAISMTLNNFYISHGRWTHSISPPLSGTHLRARAGDAA